MRTIPGVVVGIVKDLKDPQGEGRIRLEFPWLDQSYRSGWAPVAAPLAGKKRGQFFMPELEDEALVAFEHGDFDHPYIIGFLWNGVDVPPDDGINSSVRRLRTVSGHVMDFDDRPGEEKIVITTQGEQQIELKDLPGSLTLTTKGGHQIEMVDAPPHIEIKTPGNQRIRLDDTPPMVTIEAAGSTIRTGVGLMDISAPASILNVTCLQANVTSSTLLNLTASLLNVTAPVTVFSGVVVTQTLVSQAVVSAVFNPAVPGNLIGL